MADATQAVPPLPPSGELTSNAQMLLVQWQLYRNTLAFGGDRNPTQIWAQMVRGDAAAMSYYRELEEKDDTVGGALRGLRLAVLERDHSVHAHDDSQPAEDVRVFIQSQLDNLPNFHQVLNCLLDATGYGYSVGELMFDVSMGQVSLTNVHDTPQELFLFGQRYTPQIGPLQLLDSPWASTGTLVPEQKFIVYTHDMRGRDRTGRPLLRTVFWLSWFKRNVLRLWLRFAEKGPGTAVTRYKDGASDEERLQAVQAAEQLISAMAAAIPEGMQYETDLLQVARSQDPAVYEKLYDKTEYAIQRRIQGQTLTSFGGEGGKGTQALGKVHEDVLDAIAIEECRALAAAVNYSIVRPLVLWNFGPNAPMPKWGFDLEEGEDLTVRVAIDKDLQSMGYPIAKSYIEDRYGVPLPGEDDEVLKAVTPPPIPAAGGVPVPSGSQAQFSEGNATPAFVKSEFGEFQTLFENLAKQARPQLATRAKELADSVKP